MILGNTSVDRQSFITPSDTSVSKKVQEITGVPSEAASEQWRAYENLYRWIVKNTEPSIDSYTPVHPIILSDTISWKKDFWRMPSETLKDKTGDCEDMVGIGLFLIQPRNIILE
jgi:hypothetical protein